MVENNSKSIMVKKTIIDKSGKKKVVKREIPEVIPGEFDADENILAEILLDVFFAPK